MVQDLSTPAKIAPSPAEYARTLAAGTVHGALSLPTVADHSTGCSAHADRRRHTTTYRVQQLTDVTGQLLLLVDDDSALHRRLQPALAPAERPDLPGILDVLDVPPGQLCLPRARLCAMGWAEPIEPQDQLRYADAAAAARPLGALLEVSSGRTLYRFDVAEMRVTTGSGTSLVETAAFAAAKPDTLYDAESEIAAQLETHHGDHLLAYALRHLPASRAERLREVTVNGVDRYGIDLLCDLGVDHIDLRAVFSAPVDDPDSLAQQLCRTLGCPCRLATGR